MVGMVLKDIAKFLLTSAGNGFWFCRVHSARESLWFFFFMIQGGICNKVFSCISFTGIIDSCRVDFIRRLKGFDFSFLSKCCLYLGLKVQDLSVQ